MADYIPEEIIVEILKRLHIKTLIRCTCISKSWYSLITSPHFISNHLNFSSDKENCPSLHLIRQYVQNSERYALYLDNQSFTEVATFDFPFQSINSYFTIIGICNGLVCLSDDRVYFTSKIILWNPYIKKSVILPKPTSVYNSHGSFVQFLGFGYDCVTNDYKVVRITYVDHGWAQVELYKLSTGVWHVVSYFEVEYVIYSRCRQAFVQGAVHWIARFRDSYDLILLFDMCDEVFREMRLPEDLVSNDLNENSGVVKFMESLAILVYSVSGAEPSFCVWVMREYGVNESWTKHLNVDYQTVGRGIIRPLSFRRNGEVITICEDGHLICCDSDGAKARDLYVGGSKSEDYHRSVHFEGYIKTLILLDRGSLCFSDVINCKRFRK